MRLRRPRLANPTVIPSAAILSPRRPPRYPLPSRWAATLPRRGTPPPTAGYVRPNYVTWASLLERTFAIDVLACPDCGGRLRLIATITDSSVIEKILRHLGLPTETAPPIPAEVAGWLPGLEPDSDQITHRAGTVRVHLVAGRTASLPSQLPRRTLGRRFIRPASR